MRQWFIINDQIIDAGVNVDYLGVHKNNLKNINDVLLPENYDGWFPFMGMCYSIGDLGIRSGIFEALKKKYPKIKIALPTKEYVKQMIPGVNNWSYQGENKALDNKDIIHKNNPYIDKFFSKGEFTRIFTDHDRCYSSLIHDGEMVRSCDEPLAEQILRRFGFTDEDLENIDSRPKLYFDQEEIDKCEDIINKHFGDKPYGCLLFASRIESLKGRWDYDHYLIKETKEYHNKPVFYFSEFDINTTEWGKCFPNSIDFSELGLSLREQVYIKSKALFNIGYQAGITDAASGKDTKTITLCPYSTIRECCIRGTKYVYKDGSVKQF